MAHGHELIEWLLDISEEYVWSIMDPLVTPSPFPSPAQMGERAEIES